MAHGPRLDARAIARLGLGLAALIAGLLCVRLTIGLPSAALEEHVDRWVPVAAPVAAALLIGLRGLLPGQRSWGWLLIAAGQACWALGALWYSAVLWGADPMPFPSPADAAWIVFYLPTFAGIVLLAREQAVDHSGVSILDGVIGALAITAVGAAVAFGAIVEATGGSPLAIATNLAYPLGDLALIAVVVTAIAVAGWRLSGCWIGIAAGLVLFAVTDTFYLFRIAENTYEVGTLLDAGWGVASTITAFAAWAAPLRPTERLHRLSAFVFPAAFGGVALFVLVYDHFARVHVLALALATACVAAVIVRMMLIFRENLRMLALTRQEAATDALTGLGNRRKLLRDLAGVERGSLVLLDLDGFKGYNDTFGHVAGDALLARLGLRLAQAAPASARVYRLGGDEFCVLADDDAAAGANAAALAEALAEHGDGFIVSSSFGSVSIPDEAADATSILRLADQRMYVQKQQRETSAGRQSRNVLLRALHERDPQLVDHVADVADLAGDVARLLGLDDREIEHVRHAAELHDVGKVAIPDAILHKKEPLTVDEWAFIHQHTLIGERIINAAPSLSHVAKLVRWSHERWDGMGYPDRLKADAIPMGARVIAACDALTAMISERPYCAPMPLAEALVELERCAGTQFDPAVVAAVVEVLTSATGRAAA